MTKSKLKGDKKPTPAKSKEKEKEKEKVKPEVAKASNPAVEAPVAKAPVAEAPVTKAPEKISATASDAIKNSAYALHDNIDKHRSPMSKAEVEKLLGSNPQLQVLAVYSKNGYSLDVYELGNKVIRLPFTGEYPLAV